MKFSIALGLLFAGLAHSQLAQPKQASVDTFLRESQHLKPSAQLVSIKEQGPIATVTYQDGPVNFKYDVKSDGNDMKVVGIEQVMTFSGNFQFNPSNIPKPTIQIDKLPPLPLMMPQFTIQNNGQVEMKNVFDRVEKQIMQMQQRMQQNRFNFQHQMERKRQQMRENFNKKFNVATKQTPLIGGGDHDFNWATQQIEIQPNQPLIGGGDHDMNWATLQFQNEHPLIGGGDHDIWEGKPVDFEAEHPFVGGDGHDNWQNKKKKCHKNLKNEGLIGGDDHDNWKEKKHHGMKHKKQEKRERRHHSNVAWMNRQFTAEQITPYLADKLPDLMTQSQIISVKQKGFCKGKGFKLDIQLQDKQGQLQSVSVYFRPMKEELSIEKITKVKKEENSLQTGKELIFDLMNSIKKDFIKPAIEIEDQNKEVKEEKIQETEDLIAPKEFAEQSKQFLLGGENDPDHDVDFMKMPEQIQVHQDNHISQLKQEEVYQVALLEDQKVSENVQKKEEQNVQQVVIPGGKSDPDQKIEEQTPLESAMKIIEDILQQEQLQDIDSDEEVQKAEQVEEEQKPQVKEKLQLLTHRR